MCHDVTEKVSFLTAHAHRYVAPLKEVNVQRAAQRGSALSAQGADMCRVKRVVNKHQLLLLVLEILLSVNGS